MTSPSKTTFCTLPLYSLTILQHSSGRTSAGTLSGPPLQKHSIMISTTLVLLFTSLHAAYLSSIKADCGDLATVTSESEPDTLQFFSENSESHFLLVFTVASTHRLEPHIHLLTGLQVITNLDYHLHRSTIA